MISLMPMVRTLNITDEGATMNGGRRPTVVVAPASISPELSARPRRRTFTAKDKLRQNASKARTPIGEGRQFGAFRSADSVEGPADQHFDVRVRSGDGAENLAATRLRFDIANPYLQVTFCVLATPDEGGIQSG
jgi:hypothetical protein